MFEAVVHGSDESDGMRRGRLPCPAIGIHQYSRAITFAEQPRIVVRTIDSQPKETPLSLRIIRCNMRVHIDTSVSFVVAITVCILIASTSAIADQDSPTREEVGKSSPKLETLGRLSYDDLCQSGPMEATSSTPIVYFSLSSDACVQLDVTNCSCTYSPCKCTVILYNMTTGDQERWDCSCTMMDQCVDLSCFPWSAGDSYLSIDVCSGGKVEIDCCTCP